MWQAVAWPGLEHSVVSQQPDGIEVDGLVIAHVDGQSVRLSYRLRCDPDWTTRRLEVVRHGDWPVLVFESNGAGRWTNGQGTELLELAGCVDVDIAVTPFTNTLPIRRLHWDAGQARDLMMVYVAVPEMTFRLARQRYTCLESNAAEAQFRYASGSFQRDLRVDLDGLVIDYPGFWQRII
ncbi:MAG TPA: putative glycolipid-binding domain-containing protein [Candidatus Limnocylindrales bacterium]|nr:putative glycolipid-binding domain-containing protein [Candidatus Limnocylindrales bacterium]